MKINKDEIARLVIQLNHSNIGYVPDIVRKVDEAIQWAWDNWDDENIDTYYEGDKPKLPTESFIYNWVDNEDFEADGYDMEQLAEL